MDKVFQILTELMPIGVAGLIVVFVYLLKLFKDMSAQITDIAKQQAEYMTQRVEAVDKTTSIFERTIKHQEKELSRLYESNEEIQKKLEIDEIEIERLIEEIKAKAGNVLDKDFAKLSAKTKEIKADVTKGYEELKHRLSEEQYLIMKLWAKNTPEADEEAAILEMMERQGRHDSSN